APGMHGVQDRGNSRVIFQLPVLMPPTPDSRSRSLAGERVYPYARPAAAAFSWPAAEKPSTEVEGIGNGLLARIGDLQRDFGRLTGTQHGRRRLAAKVFVRGETTQRQRLAGQVEHGQL